MWHKMVYRLVVIVGLSLTVGTSPSAAQAPSCVGDCGGTGKVVVTNIITLVNIVLETLQCSACTKGVNCSNPVNVSTVIQAVNNALGMCPVTTGRCGDMIIQSAPPLLEECDNGGTCKGGMNTGTHCTAEADCQGDGVCTSGPKASTPCSSSTDCAGATCLHCVPEGGDGCASNCTNERSATFQLVKGVLLDPTTLEPGTSGAIVHGDVLTIPLPLEGVQTLVFGKERNGTIPVTTIAASVVFPKIEVGGLACACVRGIAAKTCGGTAFAKAGGQAKDCTPGYSNAGDTSKDGPCPAELPCGFVSGPGNSAIGLLGCNGLAGVNFQFLQDDLDGSCSPGPCTHPPVVTIGGSGPPGSGIILNSTAIGNVTGACTTNFCTDNDKFTVRGVITTLPLTTAIAAAKWTNANGLEDNSICNCPNGDPSCSDADCIRTAENPEGAIQVTGAPILCAALGQDPPNVSGASLAGAFTAPNINIVGDAAVTNVLVGQ